MRSRLGWAFKEEGKMAHGHGGHGSCCPVKTGAEQVEGNPEAKALLRQAFEKTARWPEGFRGFSADLVCQDNGVTYKGSVQIPLPGDATVRLEGAPENIQKWAQNQVSMMAGHRAFRTFEMSDGRYAITFGKEDEHPLGRQILIHGDGMNSRYRIKDDRIQQIDRATERMKFTINIQETMETVDHLFLSTQYVVYYFSPQGQVTGVDSLTDHPVRVGDIDLPCHRRAILAEQGEVIVRLLQFKNHVCL